VRLPTEKTARYVIASFYRRSEGLSNGTEAYRLAASYGAVGSRSSQLTVCRHSAGALFTG